ncbi:MAG: nucleotidyltransferase family protein [Paracraurococcus sp.]
MHVRTLAERRADAVAAKAAAVEALCRARADRGPALGGRYLLYGPAARGALRHDSDVDLLLDFPDPERTAAAWDFVEAEGARLGLDCDVRPLAICDARFRAHVLPGARSLP